MTKEFKRDNLFFSLCGLNCSLCPMFVTKNVQAVSKAVCVTISVT